MEILFRDILEVRDYIPWLYATSNLESLKLELELATEDVVKLVGNNVYDRAFNAYRGNVGTDIEKKLVRHFQLPIALFAYKSFAENRDISHESSGRKVKIDSESESMPWEWMIDRDDAAILKKANKTADRLIAFLDDNIDEFPEWKDSEQRQDMFSLFIRNAQQFDDVVPIDGSRIFFLRILPYIRIADKDLISFLGKERYDEIKKAMQEDETTEEQENIIGICREIISNRVMAKAVRRLAVSILPDSVVTRFHSSTQTLKSNSPATQQMIESTERIYNADAASAEAKLQQILMKSNGAPSDCFVKKNDYRGEKFFSV